jgi:hypothetical protein
MSIEIVVKGGGFQGLQENNPSKRPSVPRNGGGLFAPPKSQAGNYDPEKEVRADFQAQPMKKSPRN